MSSDRERIHRWITQADLERMLADAYRKGAEAMREAAAQVVERQVDSLMWRLELAADIRALPLPEDRR